MAAIKVTITPELVERATQRDSRHCMIAEALKEANPHFQQILVDLATIRWTNPRTKKRYVCLTPEKAASALIAFDQAAPIEPFSFRLAVMQVTAAKGAPRGRKQIDGQLVIKGGEPLPRGHLRGSSATTNGARNKRRERAKDEVAALGGDESNVKRSSTRYRQYGRRILQA